MTILPRLSVVTSIVNFIQSANSPYDLQSPKIRVSHFSNTAAMVIMNASLIIMLLLYFLRNLDRQFSNKTLFVRSGHFFNPVLQTAYES
jgi:hypothetical protein